MPYRHLLSAYVDVVTDRMNIFHGCSCGASRISAGTNKCGKKAIFRFACKSIVVIGQSSIFPWEINAFLLGFITV